MARDNWELRKQLNSISFVGLGGIRVGDALTVDTWHFQEWTKEIVNNIETVRIYEYDYQSEGERADKVFICSAPYINRKDQLEKFHAVEGLFNNKIVLIAQNKKTVRNPYLRLIPIWYMQMGRLNYSSTVKHGICYLLCKALGQAHLLMSKIASVATIKKIVCFSDIITTDNILIQMCNHQGYNTYTLQHGIINGAYDYVEHKCSHANYFLAWGEYTKWVAQKYGINESKVKVVGSMDHLYNMRDCAADAKDYKVFLVCTNGVDGKSAWNRNKKIIIFANQVAEKYQMKYYLKVHPYDNSDRYKYIIDNKYCDRVIDKSEKIDNMLKIVDFTLCGNSTTFCDSLYYKVPAFRYIADRDRSIDVCKGIEFGRVKNYEELETELDKLKENRDLYQKKAEKVRKGLFNLDNVSEKYVQAIEGDML